LSDADRGAALADYLELSDQQIASAAERMIHDGKHELAAAILQWAHARSPGRARLNASRKLPYVKFIEKYQAFNPLKFMGYGGWADQQLVQINEVPAGK